MRWKLSRTVLRGLDGSNPVRLLDEKERRGGRKQPYYFTLKDERPFAFAGLYEHWRGEDGRVIDSCTILTTEANDLLRPIHDRMPVILSRSDFDLWVDPDVRKAELLTELFAPYPAEEMSAHPVSALVNRPTVDTPEIINSV